MFSSEKHVDVGDGGGDDDAGDVYIHDDDDAWLKRLMESRKGAKPGASSLAYQAAHSFCLTRYCGSELISRRTHFFGCG